MSNVDARPRPLALERLSSVRSRTGLSRSQIYRQIAAGTFPKPAKLGPRASAWVVGEIDDWIRGRINARSSGAPSPAQGLPASRQGASK